MLHWWLPENVATYGRDIDWLFALIYWITGVTFVLVTVALLAFLVIYRDRPGRRAHYTHGSAPVEIVWTVAPGLILVVLTLLSVPAWSRIKMSEPADIKDEIRVVAKQFNWQVVYPGLDGTFGTGDDLVILDEMHVPVGRPVRVVMTSEDVIHSLFVPSFRFKQDAVPGRDVHGWFEVMKAGKYEWPCAELCGFGHSGMKGWIYAHPPEEYARWAAENQALPPQTAAAGETSKR